MCLTAIFACYLKKKKKSNTIQYLVKNRLHYIGLFLSCDPFKKKEAVSSYGPCYGHI